MHFDAIQTAASAAAAVCLCVCVCMLRACLSACHTACYIAAPLCGCSAPEQAAARLCTHCARCCTQNLNNGEKIPGKSRGHRVLMMARPASVCLACVLFCNA